MKSFSDIPSEIMLEIGETLDKEDVKNLYGTCRRLREIVVVLLRRELRLELHRLQNTTTFAVENPHFALSINTIHLREFNRFVDETGSIVSLPAAHTILSELQEENTNLSKV